MKNPFSKKRKSLDSVINSAAEIDPQASSKQPSLNKAADTSVDNTLNPANMPTGHEPTLASHGFEYDESIAPDAVDAPLQPKAPANANRFKILAAGLLGLVILGVLSALLLPKLLDTATTVTSSSPDSPEIPAPIEVDEPVLDETVAEAEIVETNQSELNAEPTQLQAQESISEPLGNTQMNVQQDSQAANPQHLNNNETLDPELQAEIDSAISGEQPSDIDAPEPETVTVDSSYEAFLKASESPILVDRSTKE